MGYVKVNKPWGGWGFLMGTLATKYYCKKVGSTEYIYLGMYITYQNRTGDKDKFITEHRFEKNWLYEDNTKSSGKLFLHESTGDYGYGVILTNEVELYTYTNTNKGGKRRKTRKSRKSKRTRKSMKSRK